MRSRARDVTGFRRVRGGRPIDRASDGDRERAGRDGKRILQRLARRDARYATLCDARAV